MIAYEINLSPCSLKARRMRIQKRGGTDGYDAKMKKKGRGTK
jgi:hypothetical protein